MEEVGGAWRFEEKEVKKKKNEGEKLAEREAQKWAGLEGILVF